MDSKKLLKVYKGLLSADLRDNEAMEWATRICGGKLKSDVRLNSTEQAMYDSLVELGGEGKLGTIRDNCGPTPNCNDGRLAYNTASYTMNALIRKGLVRRVGEGSQAFYVVA